MPVTKAAAGDSSQSIRVDDSLADGEEVVVGFSMAAPGDNPSVNNSLWVGIGFNDNDSAYSAGTHFELFWDGSDMGRILWGSDGASGDSTIFNPAAGYLFLRIVRSGSTAYGFASKNLQTWTPVGTGISYGSPTNFWVFIDSKSATFEHAPVVEVSYVRHTTYAGFDPSWLYVPGSSS